MDEMRIFIVYTDILSPSNLSRSPSFGEFLPFIKTKPVSYTHLIVIVIEVIHFPNPICTVKFSSPVVQSATARGTRWNASPLPKRTAIIPNMVNCRFPLPLRIIYRFYCGRFCIKCFPCLCVPLSDIKAVQGDSGHAQVNIDVYKRQGYRSALKRFVT